MARASRILGPDGRPYRRPIPAHAQPRPGATYDAARTTNDNSRHWANADALSARSANNLETRRTLRERARYESANNSYCRGIVLTRANDVIGTGPRLQLSGYGGGSTDSHRQVERAFGEWAGKIDLATKLRVMCQSKSVDGEPFGLLFTNDSLLASVHLDVQLIECDRITDPLGQPYRPDVVDGIRFDASGRQGHSRTPAY